MVALVVAVAVLVVAVVVLVLVVLSREQGHIDRHADLKAELQDFKQIAFGSRREREDLKAAVQDHETRLQELGSRPRIVSAARGG